MPLWTRAGMVLRPVNEAAEDLLRTVKSGTEFIVSFRNPRSPKQNRLYWGLMSLLVEHNIFPTKEAASDALKIASGHCEILVMPDTGETFMRPRSIAFESLTAAEFNPLFHAMLQVVVDRWLPVDAEVLRREVFAAIDGPARIGERTK